MATPDDDLAHDLARWSETLAGIARTGMGFTESLYERERFEEVLHVAADIKAAARGERANESVRDEFVGEWVESVGEGVPGYVTPKVAVGAIVGNDDGQILLIQRPDSGIWLYPTGWADVGYSPSEVAVKEVHEETGIECEPTRLLGVIDGQRMGFSRFGMYMLLFYCRATGGTLTPHPLETGDVGWFSEGELPAATAGAGWWAQMAFDAIKGVQVAATFDDVRTPVGRVRLNEAHGHAVLVGCAEVNRAAVTGQTPERASAIRVDLCCARVEVGRVEHRGGISTVEESVGAVKASDSGRLDQEVGPLSRIRIVGNPDAFGDRG